MLLGDFPERMMTEGRDVPKYFNSKGVVFERTEQGDGYVYVLNDFSTALLGGLFITVCTQATASEEVIAAATAERC